MNLTAWGRFIIATSLSFFTFSESVVNVNTLQMRLGYLLLAKMAHAESGFDEDITLQQGEYFMF